MLFNYKFNTNFNKDCSFMIYFPRNSKFVISCPRLLSARFKSKINKLDNYYKDYIIIIMLNGSLPK